MGTGLCRHCFEEGMEHRTVSIDPERHASIIASPKCCYCYEPATMMNSGACPRCKGTRIDPDATLHLFEEQRRRSAEECAICGESLPYTGWQGQDVCNKCAKVAAVVACVNCLEPVFKHHSVPVRPHQKGCRFRQDDGMGQAGKDRALGRE